MKYKVWIQIEECDDETDHYENVSEPMCLGVYNNQTQATMCQQAVIDAAYKWNEREVEEVLNRVKWATVAGERNPGPS